MNLESQVARNSDEISNLWREHYEQKTEVKVLCVELKNVANQLEKYNSTVNNLIEEVRESNRIRENTEPPNLFAMAKEQLGSVWTILKMAAFISILGLVGIEVITKFSGIINIGSIFK